jgi:hypothetical protein
MSMREKRIKNFSSIEIQGMIINNNNKKKVTIKISLPVSSCIQRSLAPHDSNNKKLTLLSHSFYYILLILTQKNNQK